MAAATIDEVKQEAQRAVRNLPNAHSHWQWSWRNARFRRAITNFDRVLYAADVEGYSDRHLQLLEDAVRVVIKLIEIHVSCLANGVRDEVDRQYFARMKARLEVAIEGLERGLAPDPAKRPSDDALMDRFAAGLTRAKLA